MEPFIVTEKRDYIVVFKPRGMHASPLRDGEDGTLLAWCAVRYPDVLSPRGKKAVEGGMLHRLDRETEGLVVVARNQCFLDALASQQVSGSFLKEYRATCLDWNTNIAEGDFRSLPGFPPPPMLRSPPFTIQSAFRPFGPGRKAVRPVFPMIGSRSAEVASDHGTPYRTEVLEMERGVGNRVLFHVRLVRGFRHQVRCHLAWIGFPITGDPLYGGGSDQDLCLSAVAVSFLDPVSGEPVRYECSSSMDSESTS